MSAVLNDWVVFEFDARVFGDHLETIVRFQVDGAMPVNAQFVSTFFVWTHFIVAVQITDPVVDPVGTVSFEVCGTGTRVEIDNVECRVEAADPCAGCLVAGCCDLDTEPVLPFCAITVCGLIGQQGDPREACLCPADFDGDRDVGTSDLVRLLAAWEPCPDPPVGCPEELSADDCLSLPKTSSGVVRA